MKYTISGQTLNLTNASEESFSVSFAWPISKVVTFKSVLVVLLNYSSKVIFNENVFGVNGDGTIIWQISANPSIYENSPYINIGSEVGKAMLYNWSGFSLTVKPSTGEVLLRTAGK